MNGLLPGALGWPWYLQVLVGALLLGAVFLLLRLLSEGREVSLGPIKIGARTQTAAAPEAVPGPNASLSGRPVPHDTTSYPVAVPKLRVDARPIALLYVDGGEVFVVTEAHRNIALGRNADCDAPISHRSLSRIHLRILIEPEQAEEAKRRRYRVTVVDGGSVNGTFVNGRRVERQDVHDGDIIQAGAVRIAFSTVHGAE